MACLFKLKFLLHAVPLIPEILHYVDECGEGACNYGGGGGVGGFVGGRGRLEGVFRRGRDK
jgi:hypothetical protein